ncbi:MAG: MBL fold metallo-hydrolase [Vampirovibrionales bacterium]|nr:MBL fold metallo-hydrolase [Vampirovibrionales bacterium]
MTIQINALPGNAYAIRISVDTEAEKTVLIDPVFDPIQLAEQTESLLGRFLKDFRVHYVLLTHFYPGWETIAQLLRSSPLTTVIAQEAMIERLKAEISVSDLNAITMKPGNEVDFPWTGTPRNSLNGDVQIGSLVMTESPYRPDGVLGELQIANGFIINAEGHQVCHTGYHPFDPSIKDIGAAYKPDVVIFPVSAALAYGAESVYRAIMWLGSDIVIPFDASGIPSSDSSVETITPIVRTLVPKEENITQLEDASSGVEQFDFAKICASIDIYTPAICRVLDVGQSYSLEPTHSSGRTAGPESRY